MNDNAAEGHAQFPHSKIYFRRIGQRTANPLVVLNGGPGFDHRYLMVSDVWDRFAANREIVFYDQRGTGRSSIVDDDDACTLADQLDDLDSLREYLGYQQIDILGHSWGGFLGMAYAARKLDRIRRMVLVGSGAPKLTDTTMLFEHIFPEIVERREALAFDIDLGGEDSVHRDISEYFAMLCYSPEKREALLANSDSSGYRRHVNYKVWNDASRFNLEPELRKLSHEVLVTTGRYDINVAPSVAYGIHKSISRSLFHVFERSGHLPFFEEPADFAETVGRFLDSAPN